MTPGSALSELLAFFSFPLNEMFLLERHVLEMERRETKAGDEAQPLGSFFGFGVGHECDTGVPRTCRVLAPVQVHRPGSVSPEREHLSSRARPSGNGGLEAPSHTFCYRERERLTPDLQASHYLV